MEQKNTCKDAFIQRLGVGRRACTIIALICAIGMFLSSSGTIMLASEVRNVWASGDSYAFILHLLAFIAGFAGTAFFLIFYARFLCASRKSYT